MLTGLLTQAGITLAGLSPKEVMCKGEIAVFSGTRGWSNLIGRLNNGLSKI